MSYNLEPTCAEKRHHGARDAQANYHFHQPQEAVTTILRLEISATFARDNSHSTTPTIMTESRQIHTFLPHRTKDCLKEEISTI